MLMVACSIYFLLTGLFYIYVYLKDGKGNHIASIIIYLLISFGFYTQRNYNFPILFNIAIGVLLIFGASMRISRILKKRY